MVYPVLALSLLQVQLGYDEFESKMALAMYDGNIDQAREYLHSRQRPGEDQFGVGQGSGCSIRSDPISRYRTLEQVDSSEHLYHGLDTAPAESDDPVPVLM